MSRRPAPEHAAKARAADDIVRGIRDLTVQTQRYVEGVARRMGMHRTDITTLGLLVAAARRGEPVTPGDVARRAHLSAAAVSALLDRLERVGHVTRTRHEADRRMVVVDLTEEARRTSRDMFAPLSDTMYAALQGYTEDELNVAARVLADLTDAARVALHDSPTPPAPHR